MRKLLFAIAAASLSAAPATAALKVGDTAPDFTTTGAYQGKALKIHLAEQLKKGPVVLYFFPKAFTETCDLEAHLFSEKAGEFRKLGVRVIGMSADDLPQLKRYSVATKTCSGKFPVATADMALRQKYDVVLTQKPDYAMRTSYVIDRSGKIVMEYTDMKDAPGHVNRALAAAQALKK
jgi:thioredoxin-dependent peroxiredoxin